MHSLRRIRSPRQGRKALKVGAVLLLALTASACSNTRIFGNMPDPDVVAEIRSGSSRQGDVARLLGSPSAISPFEERTWFYIGQRMHRFAFFKPTVEERQVVVVSFNDRGVVETMRTLDLTDARDVDPVSRITPTEGRDLTFLQQIFGNLGRFPTEDLQGN